MQKEFWIKRWQQGEIGWHQSEIEPQLIAWFPKGRSRRVLVPLCGKTMDMKWLAEQGHEVVGVELSELAVRAFFEEAGLEASVSSEGPYQVFRVGPYSIWVGDFFQMTAEHLGPIDAIYDRAALIALPQNLRDQYAKTVLMLVRQCARPGFEMVQIALERVPHDEQGPPHSVTEHEVRRLYESDFQVTLLSRETLEQKADQSIRECVYRLSRR